MGQMVFGIINRHLPIPECSQLLLQQPFHEELLFNPNRDSGLKTHQAPRGETVIGLQEPLEFQEWFVIKGYRGEVLVIHTGLL